jgi:hypothetical protein
MLRASLIAALSLAALAAIGLSTAGTARANELCMSLPDLTVRSMRIEQSFEVGPFFSSDGTTLISRGELDDLLSRAELEHGAGTPLTELLWCWSGNDPRCSPVAPSPDDAPRALRDVRSAIAEELYDPAAEHGVAIALPRPEVERGARDGVRASVDRPPCA